MRFRLINIAAGLWLMAAPAVLNYPAPAAHNDRIVGPVIAAMATIAIWETTRSLRHVNTLLGIWLILAPFILAFPTGAMINSIVVGAIVIAVSRQRGKVEAQFGGGWRVLWRAPE